VKDAAAAAKAAGDLPNYLHSAVKLLVAIQDEVAGDITRPVDATAGAEDTSEAADTKAKPGKPAFGPMNTIQRFDIASPVGWGYGGSPDAVAFQVDTPIYIAGAIAAFTPLHAPAHTTIPLSVQVSSCTAERASTGEPVLESRALPLSRHSRATLPTPTPLFPPRSGDMRVYEGMGPGGGGGYDDDGVPIAPGGDDAVAQAEVKWEATDNTPQECLFDEPVLLEADKVSGGGIPCPHSLLPPSPRPPTAAIHGVHHGDVPSEQSLWQQRQARGGG